MHDTKPLASARRALWLSLMLAALLTGVLALLAVWWLVGSGPKMMVVSTVDSKGQMVGLPSLHMLPTPTQVPSQGLSQLPTQIARLTNSGSRSASLSIFTPDQQRGFGMMKLNGQIEFMFAVERTATPNPEVAIRRLFTALGASPTQDYLAANGGVPNSTRTLTYSKPANTPSLAVLCRRILKEIYGITDEEGLTFRFEE